MKTKKPQDLKTMFYNQAIKWSVIGFTMTAVLAVGTLAYFSKMSSEKQISVLASSVTSAYHQMIIDGNIRTAQPQMAQVLGLKDNESIIILNKDLKQIYSTTGLPYETKCTLGVKVCWSANLKFIEILYPIYFDEKHYSIFGYADLKIKPTIDSSVVLALLVLILLGFCIQAFGLSSALGGAAQTISVQLKNWSTYLKTGLFDKKQNYEKDKNGLLSLQSAALELNSEIERIQKVAGDKARASAQMNILKELGHDLKNPISQLDKFITVLVSRLNSGRIIDQELIGYIQKPLGRIKEIARQTGMLFYDADEEKNECDLETETRRVVSEFATDDEVLQKMIRINVDKTGSYLPPAGITSTGYYRIVSNLIQNSIHAVGMNGEICITLSGDAGHPTISIRDNGGGIPSEIQGRIFDFDFTTKPSRGTGMGLGIVKKLCDIFDADLTFESEVNKGTQFKMVFQAVARSKVV